MTRPSIEVADVVRAYGSSFLRKFGQLVSSAKRRVLDAIVSCRTAALGGHVDTCTACDHEVISYNSCRNRHCPKCLGTAAAKWFAAREADLLPVRYFHVVFTVPAEIAEIAQQNKRVMYNILMQASAETLLTVAADKKHLGARIGFISVLHTWGQTLMHHPHVHVIVPGGGLSESGDAWIACRLNFFMPVRVLAALFRGKFLAMTKGAFKRGELSFQGRLKSLEDEHALSTWLAPCYKMNWVVYAKKPFGGPKQVLKYLARYTHRVAISNQRLLSVEGGRVRFRYKDYARKNKPRIMELDAGEFLRRFLLHVLPRGFMRIRHYGLFANACKQQNLKRTRVLLSDFGGDLASSSGNNNHVDVGEHVHRCPACGSTALVRVELKRSLQSQSPRAPPALVAL